MTMVGSLTLAVLLLRPRLALPFGLVVVAATLLMDGALGSPLLAKFAQLWDGESGRLWDARLPIWSAAWTSFLSAPLLGHGLHTFDYTSVDSINARWAHNLYLETLAEQGILGIAALGCLLYCGLSAARNLRRAQGAETRILGCGALAALAGFCFASLIELSFLREWVVIVLFALLGVISQLTTHNEELEVNV
jgi:O-antigen ligase